MKYKGLILKRYLQLLDKGDIIPKHNNPNRWKSKFCLGLETNVAY